MQVVNEILDAFSKLRNGIISFVMSVRQSAWTHHALRRKDFPETLYSSIFLKNLSENICFIKIFQE